SGVFSNVADKRTVNLDGVERELLERGQRGIAGAKVINGNQHTHVLQLRQNTQGLADIAHQQALGNLKLQQAGIHFRFLENLPDISNEVLIQELARREMYRHR